MMELHDSTIAEIEKRGGAIIVHLRPAYLHRSKGRPGFDSGEVFVQEARLFFDGASVNEDTPKLPCEIIDGSLVVGEQRHENLIPVPLESAGSTKLHLVLSARHTITVTAVGILLELCGEPRYVEKFDQ